MSQEVAEIKDQFRRLQEKYEQYLPKVDPGLVHDLLLRQLENPRVAPIYMLEVFTKPGVDSQRAREYIIEKTGMVPAIYDNGTHFVTNQKLTLEALKEISDSDDVLEVTGEYTGGIGAYPVSHEHGHRHSHQHARIADERAPSPSGQVLAAETPPRVEERARAGGKSSLWPAAYVAAGIIGAIVIAGAVISGGLLPNSNIPTSAPTTTSSATTAGAAGGVEPGVLHGFVAGPGGLPAVGASVVAAEQSGSGHTESAFISIDGRYFLDLPPGTYIIMVAYPDGTDKVVNNFVVERGSNHELNFSY